MTETAVILHNIRSAHNVGSLFRTADAAGVGHVYLTGYTPLPIDRFGRVQKEITKTALGAERSLAWSSHKTPAALIQRLQKDGWEVIAVEQDEKAMDYRSYTPNAKTVFLFGNEVRGISKHLRERCNVVIEIPMRGEKESLNVSVAAGIILFHAVHERDPKHEIRNK